MQGLEAERQINTIPSVRTVQLKRNACFKKCTLGLGKDRLLDIHFHDIQTKKLTKLT